MSKTVFEEIKDLWNESNYSSKPAAYWDIYKHLFVDYDREQDIRILEIGVDNGRGMELLKRVFPNCHICGIEIDESLPDSTVGNIWVGSQTNTELLDAINEEEGPFDIVVDDASHMNEHQIITFKHLFPKLNPGGIYVVEDTATSYWERFGGGYDSNSFINYSKQLIDMIHYVSWQKGFQSPIDYKRVVDEDDVAKYESYKIDPVIYRNINCISTYPNVSVIYKSKVEAEYQAVLPGLDKNDL
tara:strand:- start:314 stop:1042 length:729 start_codon:yes stop_codon:yes gene_type:complete